MTLGLLFHELGGGIGSPNATLTDLQVHADGYLEFAGAALTGTYETPEGEPTGFEKGERFHLHAFAVADQIHPLTINALALVPADDERFARWTVEGPLWTLPSEAVNCTILVEVSILSATTAKGGAGWSSFSTYRPGIYWGVGFKFKVTVTRPSTDYQIKLHRFQTRSTRVQKARYEYSVLERASWNRILRR